MERFLSLTPAENELRQALDQVAEYMRHFKSPEELIDSLGLEE
ncbi:MAG TPA: hypothetical protein PLQ89_21825 [Phycisphaerae bacterium]|nr:hypothetical protein [Phycisphaerae bacterium]HOJ73043.1 hypothetical protein [Phycisphaerae bacterium]HOQ88351.1 hypothetical protein [Phycisphaerae bacterium]